MTSRLKTHRPTILLVVLLFLALTAHCQQKPPAKAPKAPANQTVSSPTDSIHDTLPNSFNGEVEVLSEVTPPKTTPVVEDIKRIEGQQQVQWPSADANGSLYMLVNKYFPPSSPQFTCSLTDSNQVYIFHVVHWTPDAGKFRMVSSSWYAYSLTKKGTLKFVGLDGSGQQEIFNKKNALIVGLSGFDDLAGAVLESGPDKFQEAYQSTAVQGTAENLKDLGILISSIGGFASAATAGAEGGGQVTPISLSIGCQKGTPKLPFTINVTSTAVYKSTDKPPTAPSSGATTCSGSGNITPCASSHSFQSTDPEFWDISIGITTPGTRETKYAFSSGAVQQSVTRHTDLYAMLDVFPFGAKWPKDSACPHVNIGLPVTSQSLYRPFFGISENITSWTAVQRKLALPVGVNFFAGVVYMKTHFLIDDPTTQQEFNSDLKTTRVWKAVFGFEIPLRSMASKLGNKAKSGSGKSN